MVSQLSQELIWVKGQSHQASSLNGKEKGCNDGTVKTEDTEALGRYIIES